MHNINEKVFYLKQREIKLKNEIKLLYFEFNRYYKLQGNKSYHKNKLRAIRMKINKNAYEIKLCQKKMLVLKTSSNELNEKKKRK